MLDAKILGKQKQYNSSAVEKRLSFGDRKYLGAVDQIHDTRIYTKQS